MPSRRKVIAETNSTNIIVTSLVYIIVITGAYFVLSRLITSSKEVTQGQMIITCLLLCFIPAVLGVGVFVNLNKLRQNRKRRIIGYKLQTKTIIAFVFIFIISSLPLLVFVSNLSIDAVEIAGSEQIRDALNNGMDLALSFYAEKEKDIKLVSENEILPSISKDFYDATTLLEKAKLNDSNICAIEVFAKDRTVSFAGDHAVKMQNNVMPEKSGLLPRMASVEKNYTRYFAKKTRAESNGISYSVLVSMEFPAQLDEQTSSLSKAMTIVNKRISNKSGIINNFRLFLTFYIVIAIVPLLFLVLILAISISETLVRPIIILDDAICGIESNSNHINFLAKSDDEAGRIISKLNEILAEQEKSKGTELRNEKLGAWRDIARKLAHELKNPLTPIRLSAERLLKRWKNDPESINGIVESSLMSIIQETANMDSLLTEFRDFARLPEPQKDWMNLRTVVLEVVELYKLSWPKMTIDCSKIDENIILKADKAYIKQAFGNLISNAAHATEEKGNIWIEAELVKTEDSKYCRIQIRDDGCGIPDDLKAKIFTPYFTTKAEGTGLGLAIVEHIISAHGGKIRFDSSVGAGTIFYIDLLAEEKK